MSEQRWYVVHTQPNGEGRADLNLRRQGFATYLPRYARRRRHARRREMVKRPLVPRYLFVGLDLGRDRWRAVHSTFGVNRLVLAGEEPLPLPDGVIDAIRAREDDDGLVALGLPAGVGPGSRVRLVDGIFADANAGGYDEAMRDGTEDWEFNIRLVQAGFRGVEIAKPLFI